MRAVANSDDADLQDTSTRLLGSWMTLDAGPVLLELATDEDGSYKVRALRGYIRLARQFVMTDAERAQMCRRAWDAAERDAEQKLVLQVIGRYPSVAMLQLALDTTQNPDHREAATAVAAAVAEKTGGAINVEALLAQVQDGPVEVEIVKATYGAGEKAEGCHRPVAKTHRRDRTDRDADGQLQRVFGR